MLIELRTALEHCREDEDVKILIVTGSGEKAFVAGADIKELMELDPMEAKETSRFGQAVFDLVERFPKPVIAAINGFCLGGGCELALACHIRIASENAKLGQPEVKLGLIPGYGGTQRLPRMVGKGQALELILTGEMITAQRALEMGLVNHVVSSDVLIDTCKDLAGKIRANGPLAVQYAIEAVNTGLEMPLLSGLALESNLFGLCGATEDMKEGTGAFVEKRHPDFKGK
jgi:enoyl-CoA hydratase